MANTVNVGSTTINDCKLGNSQVSNIYVGNTLVWSKVVAPAQYRFVRFQGFGDNTNAATTRLVEIKAIETTTGTNLLLNKTPISGEAVSTGGTIAMATDGLINYTSGQYPIWWTASGIPTLTYDLLALKTLNTLNVWMYTATGDLRQTKFKLWVSKDNVDWSKLIVDYSTNTTTQDPTNGWSFTVPTT